MSGKKVAVFGITAIQISGKLVSDISRVRAKFAF